MYLRAAEQMIHEAAHDEVMIDGQILLPPSAAAKELWLQWLARYAPTDLAQLSRATLSLLQADAASERGLQWLTRLMHLVYGPPHASAALEPTRLPSSAASDTYTAPAAFTAK